MGEVLTDAFKHFLADIQDYSEMSARAVANLASGPRYFQDILDQMDDIGVGSLPIVLMSGFFIGAVMVLQTGSQFVRFGQTDGSEPQAGNAAGAGGHLDAAFADRAQ